jgi:hypothetical protein
MNPPCAVNILSTNSVSIKTIIAIICIWQSVKPNLNAASQTDPIHLCPLLSLDGDHIKTGAVRSSRAPALHCICYFSGSRAFCYRAVG